MTCKDCVHYEVCDYTSILDEFVEKNCKSFKNKEKIISALEKQIPKKVKRYESHKGGKIKCLGACEVCGCAVQPNESYCLRCGQALDWSDTE